MSIRAFASLVLVTVVLGCSDGSPSADAPPGNGGPADPAGGAGGDGTAVLVLALTTVPSDVQCIRVMVAGSQTVTRTFDVNPGDGATLMFGGLPVGDAVITEATFNAVCADVTPNTEATWISEAPVTLSLVSNSVATAKVVLVRPAGVMLTNDFREGGLSLTPPNGDFGTVAIGATKAIGFVVGNSGRTTLGPLSVSHAGSGDFQVTSDSCSGQSIAAGGACSIFVQLAPSKTGPESGTLTVTGSGSTVSASLAGTAVSGAMLTLTPPSVSFPSTVVGATTATQTLDVQNSGGVDSGVLTAAISPTTSDFSIVSNGCTQSLTPGMHCSIGLQFKPTAIGARTAQITVSGASSASASLSGMGIGGLALSPAVEIFPPVTAGSNGAPQTFTVTNGGTTSAGPLNTTITAGQGNFTITSNACSGMTLLATKSCQLQIMFNPLGPGTTSGTLTVSTASGLSATSSLTGTGVASAPWSTTDIGSPSPTGAFSQLDSSFDVTGGGADIWSTSDSFRFGYQPVSGDATITAKLTTVASVDLWTKAMLMMRDGTAANARYAAVFGTPTPANGYRFQSRVLAGDKTTSVGVDSGTLPVWLRLVRTGNTFTGFFSRDGLAWTLVSSATITNMSTTLDVGMAVTSHHDGTGAKAHFDFVTITKP